MSTAGFGKFRVWVWGLGIKEFTWRGRGLSKPFISTVIIRVTPYRVLITLLVSYLLSPLFYKWGLEFRDFRDFRV